MNTALILRVVAAPGGVHLVAAAAAMTGLRLRPPELVTLEYDGLPVQWQALGETVLGQGSQRDRDR